MRFNCAGKCELSQDFSIGQGDDVTSARHKHTRAKVSSSVIHATTSPQDAVTTNLRAGAIARRKPNECVLRDFVSKQECIETLINLIGSPDYMKTFGRYIPPAFAAGFAVYAPDES
jgi:hypothetical protein